MEIVAPPRSGVVHKFLIALNIISLVAPPAGAVPPTAHHPGKWTNTISLPQIQVHATIQPSDQAHSSILWWRGDESAADNNLSGGLRDWNPPSDSLLNAGTFTVTSDYFADRAIPDPNVDIFCGGQSHLAEGGQVLITGGNQIGEIGLKHALVFDPAKLLTGANPWVVQPDMQRRRWYPTNTTLGNGKTLVLSGSEYRQMVVFGGVDSAGGQNDLLQRFGVASGGSWDPVLTPTWTGSRPTEREGLSLLPSRGNGIYGVAFGGRRDQAGGAVYSNTVYRLDRDRNDFTADYGFRWTPYLTDATDPEFILPGARAYTGAVTVETDSLYLIVVGGIGRATETGPEVVFSDVWRATFQPNFARWRWTRATVTGTTPGARYGHSLFYDPDTKQLYLYGGSPSIGGAPTDGGVWSLSVEALTGTSGRPSVTWQPCTVQGAQQPGPRTEHTLTPDLVRFRDNGTNAEAFTRAILFGGRTSYSPSTLADNTAWQLWIVDSTHVNWRPLVSVNGPPPARANHGAAIDAGAHGFAIAGGTTAGSSVDRATWFADLLCEPCGNDTLHWEHLGDMATGRTGFRGLFAATYQHFPRIPEVYTPGPSGVGSWVAHTQSFKLQDWYPFMFQLPSSLGANRVFMAGPEDSSYALDLNPGTPAWQGYPASNVSGFRGGSAAMFRPGQIVKVGSRDTDASSGTAHATTKSIDLTAASPAWTPSVNDMRHARVNHNLTLLPSGEAIVTGGSGGYGNDQNVSPVRRPEIWNPDYTDAGQPGRRGWWYGANAGETIPLDTTTAVRGYHSSTLLLPDGRLYQGGGNANAAYERTVAQYSPPYLFEGNGQPRTRAKILGVKGRVAYDDTLSVVTDVAVDHFVLMRAGAVTHGFDQDQRYVRLLPDGPPVTTTPPRQRVRIPADPNTVPPGPYMLFAMKADGTPSIARWLFVGPPPYTRDMGDRERPGAVTLGILSGCTGTAAVYWNAPSDDSTFAVTGPAASYDLRYRGGPINGWSDFSNLATPLPGVPTPAAPGTMQVADVDLPDGSYTLALISRDDRNAYSQNTSPLSNALTLNIQGCSGGGTGGDPGDELRDPIVHRGPEQSSMGEAQRTDGGGTASSFTSVSLLSGVPDGAWASDRVALPREPVLVDGRRMVRVYRGATGTTDLDEVSLVALDHATGAKAEVLPTRAVAGVRVEPLAIHDAEGRDVASRFTGDPSACFVGDLGDAVTLTFPPAAPDAGPAALLVSGRAVRRPSGEPGGLLVQVRDGESWRTVAIHQPRERLGESVVDSVDGEEVRLVFQGNGALLRVARLVPGAAPTRHDLTAAAARHSRLGEVSAATLAPNAEHTELQPADTLYAFFDPPADPAPGMERRWFLQVRGRQTGGGGTSAGRSQRPVDESATPPTRFALHQNVPNPFRGTTTIAFDLPVSSRVTLDVYDAQGRRVRRFASGYVAGRHAVEWDLRTSDGRRAAPGLYLYRLAAGSFRAERKMAVVP